MSQTFSNTANQGLIVAVDGPSGAGKSTVCRAVAEHFHARYLDTGAMYRVATLFALQHDVDITDAQAVARITDDLPLVINDDPRSTAVMLAGVDVSQEIRGAAVTQNVSAVSAVMQVRENLVALQQRLVEQAHRCVVDGRDIGTTVLPDAPVKIFLTASPEVRAQRRFAQDQQAGRPSDYETILADIIRRDELDSSREISPLRPAADAIILDSSDLSREQVISTMISLVEQSGTAKELHL